VLACSLRPLTRANMIVTSGTWFEVNGGCEGRTLRRLSQRLRPTVAWDERPSGRDERLFLTVLRLDLPFR
jgi:hypothetical protein